MVKKRKALRLFLIIFSGLLILFVYGAIALYYVAGSTSHTLRNLDSGERTAIAELYSLNLATDENIAHFRRVIQGYIYDEPGQGSRYEPSFYIVKISNVEDTESFFGRNAHLTTVRELGKSYYIYRYEKFKPLNDTGSEGYTAYTDKNNVYISSWEYEYWAKEIAESPDETTGSLFHTLQSSRKGFSSYGDADQGFYLFLAAQFLIIAFIFLYNLFKKG